MLWWAVTSETRPRFMKYFGGRAASMWRAPTLATQLADTPLQTRDALLGNTDFSRLLRRDTVAPGTCAPKAWLNLLCPLLTSGRASPATSRCR